MPNNKDVRWLLVGTGDIVRKRVADAIASTSGSTLAGVVGGLERATDIAGQFGGQAYASLDEALARCDAEAVYVATQVDRHLEQSLAAIHAGRAVLIEKPLGVDAAAAGQMAMAAEQAGVTAGCAYYRRLFPRYLQLQKQLEDGLFGPITLVRTTYHAWFAPTADDPKHWRVERSRGGGGPLADMGSHMIDLIVGLFGLPRRVYALTATLVQDFEVEDSSVAVLELANGGQVMLSFGWNSRTWVHEFEVVGREARVRWAPADAGAVVVTVGRDVHEEDLPNAENVHGPLISDFVAAMRQGRPPACPLSQAAMTNQVLDAIYRSSATGAAVVLAE